MDLLLAHGYFLSEDAHERAVMRPYPPLGLLYLSSHLKARGVEVGVFDSTFSTPDDFAAVLDREHPAVVGIYANLMTRGNALRLMAMARARGARIVVGGPEPANYIDEYLQAGADVVVIGEGELTLEALLPALDRLGPHALSGIEGIAFRDQDGAIVRTAPRTFIKDLDAQPWPDRAAIDIPRYVDTWRAHHDVGSVSLITSRGCPFTCAWCSHSVYGYSYRWRSAARVADEVEAILETYHPDLLWYADDVFGMNRRWLDQYAAELKRRGRRVPFETISREDRLDEQVVRTLADMGCFRLWIGSESGSQRVLDAMDRRTDAARVVEMVKLLQRHGIQAGLFVMLGYEGEEPRDIAETTARLRIARPDAFLTTVAYPIKGTPYYERVRDRVVPLKSWSEGSDRDVVVAGRRSRRFYRAATRWMVGSVALERAWREGPRDWNRIARAVGQYRDRANRHVVHQRRPRRQGLSRSAWVFTTTGSRVTVFRLIAGVFAVRLVVFIACARHPTPSGFVAYYTAAQLLAGGEDVSRFYDDGWFAARVANVTPAVHDIYTVNPPTTAWLLRPLAGFDYASARVAWIGVSLFAWVVAMMLLLGDLGMSLTRTFIFLSFALAAQPLAAGFALGQAYALLSALVVAAWLGFRHRRHALLGLALALLLTLKAAGLAIVVLLIAARRWRALAWTVGISLALVGGLAAVDLDRRVARRTRSRCAISAATPS